MFEKLNFCSKCKTGGPRGFVIQQDYSSLLAVVEKLQNHFNGERTFFETLKCFLTAPHWLTQEDPTNVDKTVKNSCEISQEYNESSNKFTAANKHFKIRINKADNFKKKLIFSPNGCDEPQFCKDDSENLFVDSRKTPLDVLKHEKSDSYLDLQPSIDDPRNSPIVKSPGSHRKRAKRKLSKNDLATDVATEKRFSKTRKISIKSGIAYNSDEGPFKSTKARTSAKNPSPSTNAFSKHAEGAKVEAIKMMTRSRSNSLGNKTHECNRPEERAKSIENLADPVMQTHKLADSSSRPETDGKRKSVKVHQGKNMNSIFSLPDPEMEEPVDILWQRDETVPRKKKALLFKSVKERNRRSIFFDASIKLHSTDKVNFVEQPISVKESESSNGSQIDLKQSLEKSAKKEDITLTSDLTDSRPPDQQEAFTKASSSNESSSVMETNESSCAGKSSVSQTCSDKLVSQMKNEEDKIQASSTSCPVPPTNDSMAEIFPQDNSKLEVEPSILNESKIPSSSIEASTASVTPKTNESPVDAVCEKSLAPIDSVSATCNPFSSTCPQSPAITYASSSSSVELIEKSSQATIATISDTDVNGDQNLAGEIVTSTPSQPIIFTSSSEDVLANKTKQTANAFQSDEMEVDGSGRFKADDSLLDNSVTKMKCAKLKKAINDQNEQLLQNIRSTFKFASPDTLSIVRNKSRSISSSNKNAVNSSPKKIEFGDRGNVPGKPTESPKTRTAINSSDCEKSVSYSKNGDLSEELLTIPASPRTISVACQTTSDLHLSLLRQEFPHLFNQQNVDGSSDKCTPTDSKARGIFKTPQISASRHINFATISSVTSSEKKHFDNLFTERSVLDDSSFHCAAEKTVDISIQPLPRTEEKVFPATDEQPYSSTRLTFKLDPDVDVEKQEMVDSSMCASSTPLSQTKSIYSSSGNAALKVEMDESILKRAASESNQDEFVGSDQKNGITAIEKVDGDQDNGNESNDDSVDVVPDTNATLDTSSMVQSTGRITPEAVANLLDHSVKNNGFVTSATNCESHNGTIPNHFDDDDEDDVEFIAGTPTGSRRCVDDNLEKLMTQSFSVNNKEVSSENERVLFDLTNCTHEKTPLTQSLMDYSRPRPPLPIPASEMSDVIQKASLDLFNSASSVQESPSVALVISGLKDADVKLVKSFCQRFSVSLSDRITSATTHLVVKTDRKNRTARTFKYLQAMVNSICVISIEWVQACIDNDEILNEEKFIPFDSSGECGPLRAYKSRKEDIPSQLSWLRDYCVLFMEPVPAACTLTQLQEIVEKTGAVVISDLKDFKKYATLHHLIIVSDEEDGSQTSNSDIANWLQSYQAVAIEFNWLLEVVGRNRVVPFADYELVEIPSNLLLKFAFPNEMLQFEREDVDDSD